MKKVLTVLIFFLPSALFGATPTNQKLQDIYVLYKKGAYQRAIEELKSVKGDKSLQGTVSYWKGLCESRLQKFNEAASSFQKAAHLGVRVEDLQYELGQAFYASKKFGEARKAFLDSAKKGFKKGASLYYIGYTYQSEDQPKEAIKAYETVQKFSSDDDGVKQPALLQLAEIAYNEGSEIKDQKKLRDFLKASVVPKYERTVAFNDQTASGDAAEARLAQIQSLIDGPKSGKPWALGVGETVTYDSNVVTQADQALVQLSNAGSAILNSKLNGHYDFRSLPRISLKPGGNVSHKYHTRRSEPRVIQNDELGLTAFLKNRWDHGSKEKPGSLLLDFNFDYKRRDFEKTKNLLYYSHSYDASVGERYNLLGPGGTTFKLHYKYLLNHDDAFTARTWGPSLDQNITLSDVFKMTLSFLADFQKANSDVNDLYTYRASTSLASKEIFWKILPRVAFAFTLQDTRLQRPTRGNELIYNPSLDLDRMFGEHFSANLHYAFTYNKSKDKQNYLYKKHEVSFGVTYNL